MTHTLNDRTMVLRELLERQFQEHTDQLGELRAAARERDHGGHDPDTLRRLVEATQQRLADAVQALRRMSEGSYGVCADCGHEIPTARLEARPSARYCVPCQQLR